MSLFWLRDISEMKPKCGSRLKSGLNFEAGLRLTDYKEYDFVCRHYKNWLSCNNKGRLQVHYVKPFVQLYKPFAQFCKPYAQHTVTYQVKLNEQVTNFSEKFVKLSERFTKLSKSICAPRITLLVFCPIRGSVVHN